jgi:hypothetical protein
MTVLSLSTGALLSETRAMQIGRKTLGVISGLQFKKLDGSFIYCDFAFLNDILRFQILRK